MSAPRVAVRAVVVDRGRVLLVNAYPGEASDLWCAPGGGVEAGASLRDNLVREVLEETGLRVRPGRLVGLSEFHNPETGFHQVDLLFRARLAGSARGGAARSGGGGEPAALGDRGRCRRPARQARDPGAPRLGPRASLLHEGLDVMVP